VASSRIRIGGFLGLPCKATRCFSPPTQAQATLAHGRGIPLRKVAHNAVVQRGCL
jgi:hypothetical protein